MRRGVGRLMLATALVALGWVAGRAQSTQPDFEFVVNSPGGETTVECRRGCNLAWVERGVNPNAKPMPTFTFNCRNPEGRCSSFGIGGWLTR